MGRTSQNLTSNSGGLWRNESTERVVERIWVNCNLV